MLLLALLRPRPPGPHRGAGQDIGPGGGERPPRAPHPHERQTHRYRRWI